MSVYNDMANDAGCPYGTDENEQLAQFIEEEHIRQYSQWQCQKCGTILKSDQKHCPCEFEEKGKQ